MPSLEDNTTQVGAHTDNRHIIPVKSQGFFQTPQDIMGEYNGCSVPQYTAYPCIQKDSPVNLSYIDAYSAAVWSIISWGKAGIGGSSLPAARASYKS